METGNVNLTISKEIVNPIVEAKIKEAVIAAMGGANDLIAKVVKQIIDTPVSYDGKISQYSSDNKYKWLDIAVTNQIKEAAKEAIREMMSTRKDDLKKAIVKELSSKKGVEAFAQSLLSNSSKILENYYSTIEVTVKQK